jgi:hypothetical protein
MSARPDVYRADGVVKGISSPGARACLAQWAKAMADWDASTTALYEFLDRDGYPELFDLLWSASAVMSQVVANAANEFTTTVPKEDSDG